MKDLIAKLEAATGPSRELDWEIWFNTANAAADHRGDNWPTYTSSFDAILTLARTQGDAFKIVDAAANAETFRGRMAALNRIPLDLWLVRKAALLAALRARDGGRHGDQNE